MTSRVRGLNEYTSIIQMGGEQKLLKKTQCELKCDLLQIE